MEKKNRKQILVFLFSLLVVGGLILPVGIGTAHAGVLDATRAVASGAASNLLNLLGVGADAILGNAFALITDFIAWIASYIMAAGGVLLDLSIKFSIQSQNFRLDGIEKGWGAVRDVANMTFIFILLYIAIATILQAGSFNTKRILATLIVIALLVNFSFFLTGIVIDASNILALIIYNGMVPNDATTISTQLADALDLESVFDKSTLGSLDAYQIGIANVLSAMFFLTAGFVFLAGAIMFILRTIVLMFVLVLSPIAFAAAILPATKKHFDSWLDKLINNAFVAPVFLLMIFLVLQIVNGGKLITAVGKGTGTSVGTYAAAIVPGADPNPGNFAIFLVFALIIGLIIGALTISKSMAGGIASLSVKYAGKATSKAMGVTAFAGRQTLGRAAQMAADSEWLKDREAAGGRIAGLMRTGSGYAAQSSFDLRGAGVTGAAAGALGTDFGRAGGRGGYRAQETRQVERRVRRAGELEEVTLSGEERAQREELRNIVGDDSRDEYSRTTAQRQLEHLEGRGRERRDQFAQGLEDRAQRSRFLQPITSQSVRRRAVDQIRRGETDMDRLLRGIRRQQEERERASGGGSGSGGSGSGGGGGGGGGPTA